MNNVIVIYNQKLEQTELWISSDHVPFSQQLLSLSSCENARHVSLWLVTLDFHIFIWGGGGGEGRRSILTGDYGGLIVEGSTCSMGDSLQLTSVQSI